MNDMELMYGDNGPRGNVSDWGSNEDHVAEKVMPADAPALTEQQLIKDPAFQSYATLLYDRIYKNPTITMPDGSQGQAFQTMPEVDKEKKAKWLIKDLAFFNNNLPKMFIDYQKLKKVPLPVLKTWYEAWQMYEDTPNTLRSFRRGVGYMVSDITTFIGFNLLARPAVKGIAKWRIKKRFKDMIEKALTSPALQYSLEAPGYMGAIGHVRESVKTKADPEHKYDIKEPLGFATAGLVLGLGLGGGIQLAPYGWRAMKKLADKASKSRFPLD